jgi:hypothetical protein
MLTARMSGAAGLAGPRARSAQGPALRPSRASRRRAVHAVAFAGGLAADSYICLVSAGPWIARRPGAI